MTFSSDRRSVLAMGGGAALAAFLSGCVSGAGNAGRKPNILYIMTDDHAPHALGAYGSRLASLNPTPTLDALAAEGTLFTNVFVTNSICTPSRASIMTGQYSQTNGVLDLDGELAPENQALAHQMRTAGYQTAMIGKWHLKQEPAAFDFYEVLDNQGTYFDPIFFVRGPNKWGKNVVRTTGHSSDIITDITLDWLQQREDERPFFLMHHYKAPHDLFEYAPRYENYLADVEIPEPADLYERTAEWGSVATRGENDSLIHEIGTSIGKRNSIRNMGHHFHIDQSLPDREYAHQAYQAYLKAYLRCVKGVDDNLARLFDYLKASGEWDNTIIIYTADQGFMLGEHDFIDKRWMYEESMHMPFIVRDPFVKNQVKRSDILVNNTDFAPFMLDLAGAQVPDSMQGRSFAAALTGATPAGWRTATYYRYWMHRAHHLVPAHFGVRSDRYKLIFFYGRYYVDDPKNQMTAYNDDGAGKSKSPINWSERPTPPAWELYDLEKDPQELRNVYSDPAYAGVVRDLTAELMRQREQYRETDENYPELQKIIDAHWDD